MEISVLKKQLNDLGYKDYLFVINEIAITNGTSSKIRDELITVFIIKKGDEYIMTDRFELINSFAGHDEIKNSAVIKDIEEFASKLDVSFEKYLFRKKFDTNRALKPQIEDMFKVLIYADDVFSKNKNE